MQGILPALHYPSFWRMPESSSCTQAKPLKFRSFGSGKQPPTYLPQGEGDTGVRQNDGDGVASLLGKALTALLLTNTVNGYAESDPTKPIRYIIPFAPSSGQDLVRREAAGESGMKAD